MSRKNRTGRPPGSKNIEYMPVIEIPPACKCGCTVLITVCKPPIIKPISGNRYGHEYDQIVWIDKECTSCHQRVRVISYQKTITNNNIPDKTTAKSSA